MFNHEDEGASDESLHEAARQHLAGAPHLQLVAELLTKLRTLDMDWWGPELLRSTWSARARMTWLAGRPDLRQGITSELTGLPANTARRKTPEFQAELIDSVLDAGDVSATRFDEAFDPCDLVVYGPAAEIWSVFRERMPWEDQSPEHQRLAAWLLRALLADRSTIGGMTRRPIMTPWEVRAAVDPLLWQTRVPAEIRAAVDEARLRHEKAKPREPFTTRQELAICTPDHLAANIPLLDLATLLGVAERNMGFGVPQAEVVTPVVELVSVAHEGQGPRSSRILPRAS